MQTILKFLIKYNHWFLFILLEGISVMLIVRFNNYQSAAFFTSTNSVAGEIYNALAQTEGYFNLRGENETLLSQNKELTRELTKLRAQLAEIENRIALDSNEVVKTNRENFIFNTANIVNNSLNSLNNFIVLDKGHEDGIEQEMGVFDNDGVIGIIYLTSKHYSLVLPLLNSKSSISCRIQGNNGFSTLQWDGKDARYSYLVDLPRYTRFEHGDTVLTSGFSSIFPAGIPVGTIEKLEDSPDGMFYRAKVKLFVDFSTITSVFIVGNSGYKEQKELESKQPEE